MGVEVSRRQIIMAAGAAVMATALKPSVAISFKRPNDPDLSGLNHNVNITPFIGSGIGGVDSTEVALIRRLGFKGVRLPLDPDRLGLSFNTKQPRLVLDQSVLNTFEDVVSQFVAAGMTVTVDMHPQRPFMAALAGNPKMLDLVFQLWETLARILGKIDAEKVVFEILNEPNGALTIRRWNELQPKIAEVIRSVSENLIIATGANFSSIDALVQVAPIKLPNVAYSFHFYEPMVFTHQGMELGGASTVLRYLAGLPYPSSVENVENVMRRIVNRNAMSRARKYGEEGWNRLRIERSFRQVIEWRRIHGVGVIMNEFGVYRGRTNMEQPVPSDSRACWLRDVREIAEMNGIPWALWNLRGDFGITKRLLPPTQTLVVEDFDSIVLQNLGLTA